MAVIPRLHDPANVQQTSSKCIQNTGANCSTFAGNLQDVCWRSAGSLLLYVIMDEPARRSLDRVNKVLRSCLLAVSIFSNIMRLHAQISGLIVN